MLVVGSMIIYAFAGKLINMRRFSEFTAVAAQRVKTHLISGDKQDVSFGRQCSLRADQDLPFNMILDRFWLQPMPIESTLSTDLNVE